MTGFTRIQTLTLFAVIVAMALLWLGCWWRKSVSTGSKATQFCLHPMVVSDQLNLMGLKEHTPFNNKPYASIQAAKRYCTRLQLAGFSCNRYSQDDIVLYDYIDEKDKDVNTKLMKASEEVKGVQIDRVRVFYQRSDSPCRATVAGDIM